MAASPMDFVSFAVAVVISEAMAVAAAVVEMEVVSTPPESRWKCKIVLFILGFGFFDGNGAATEEFPSALLLQSDVTSDVMVVSSTLVDTSIDGIVTSDFNFLPLLRGKFPLLALLLAFSRASILLTAFDTLIDEVVLMKVLLLLVWLVVVVVVKEDVSDVRFPVVPTSMSAVILSICLLFFMQQLCFDLVFVFDVCCVFFRRTCWFLLVYCSCSILSFPLRFGATKYGHVQSSFFLSCFLLFWVSFGCRFRFSLLTQQFVWCAKHRLVSCQNTRYLNHYFSTHNSLTHLSVQYIDDL